VELFEQIRREHGIRCGNDPRSGEEAGCSPAHGARSNWRTQFPENERLRFRPKPEIRGSEGLSSRRFLEADQTAPRKQRHTARRIWCRIRAEMPEVNVAESSISSIRSRAEDSTAIGSARRRFISAVLRFGVEKRKVDWYEAYADYLRRARGWAYVFCMRSMASGGAFPLQPSRTPANKRFLEAHGKGRLSISVEYSRLSVYDNLKKCGEERFLRGHQREESIRFHRLSDPIGVSRRSFARRERGTKRAAWKGEGRLLSPETTWCPVPTGQQLGRTQTISCWEASKKG